MASLKALRDRIASVQSTQRITSAMKMVAAAKLRKAQNKVQAARPYAERMERLLRALATGAEQGDTALPLLAGSRDQTHLLVLISSDRGLCGGFNGGLARALRMRIDQLTSAGKAVYLLIIGRKGGTLLRRDHGERILAVFEDLAKPEPRYGDAGTVSAKILALFAEGRFDVCTLFYNRFVSTMSREATPIQLIPFADDRTEVGDTGAAVARQYEYEPSEEVVLEALLPKNLTVQIFRAMLESFASEQAARMAAMDSATRNAGAVIHRLSVTYNRSRQAQITKELIEIISGAEAL